MSKHAGCLGIHFPTPRAPAFSPSLPFSPPAILLLRYSHTGLGLNEKCIVSFIHSSQKVIELICLASVCWGAAEIRGLCLQWWNLGFKRWNKNVSASLMTAGLTFPSKPFIENTQNLYYFPPLQWGWWGVECHTVPSFHCVMSIN